MSSTQNLYDKELKEYQIGLIAWTRKQINSYLSCPTIMAFAIIDSGVGRTSNRFQE